jgi:DNA polymerase-3 subunit delta'
VVNPLIGNARAVAAVQRALASASPPHAWLFVGPEGVGKAALARWLAQALNCVANVDAETGAGARLRGDVPASEDVRKSNDAGNPANVPDASPLHDGVEPRSAVEPCRECTQCDRIARGIHADVSTITILPPENGTQHKDISVDQIREVERAVSLAPFEGRTRVVIIDPADDMSIGAQNAFLKTLEEPPPNTAFVLIATHEDALLQTVCSRCRRIGFTLVPVGEIENALREQGLDGERARLLARLAGGRPGRALVLAQEPARIEKRTEVLKQARELGSMPMADLMDLSERLAARFREDREAVLSRLAEWLGWWRDIVLVQSGAEEGVANVDLLGELREHASNYSRADAVTFVQALRECRRRLEGNVQARIALDAMMVMAPRVASSAR